jgi:hypothetical protein
MSEVIHHEILFFLISGLTGILLLAGYDQLRVFRRVVPHNWFFQSLEDFFYWTIAGIFCFIVSLKANSGAIRGFSLAAIMAGMWFYYETLSRWVVRCETFVFRTLLFPAAFLSKKIGILCQKTLKKVKRCFKMKRTGQSGVKDRGSHEAKKETKRK